MVLTVLEGRVLEANWGVLAQAFGEGIQDLESGIVQTFLVQNKREKEVWRIMTFWESQEALDEMRNSGQTPKGVVFFRAAKSDPVLSVFEVVNQISRERFDSPPDKSG